MFDRLARRARPLVWLLCIAAAPVFFISYIFAMKLALDAWGMAVWLLVAVCHAIVWIGAASLHDWQREQGQKPRQQQSGQ